MIKRLTIDGKEHVALVFGEWASMSDVWEMRKGLHGFACNAAAQKGIYDYNDESGFYDMFQLLAEMDISEQEVFQLYDSKEARKEADTRTRLQWKKKPCELWELSRNEN